jgi:hypothetical protein
MKLSLKPDWDECQARIEAWWRGEIIDRVPIMVTAPREGRLPPDPEPDDFEAFWTDPAYAVRQQESYIEATYYAGEAIPVMYPVRTSIPAMLAVYLGCALRFLNRNTGWADPIPAGWGELPPLEFNPSSRWWRISAGLLKAGAERAPGRFLVGLPDLNGPGEALARMRGSENLCFDVLEHPDEIRRAVDEITFTWYRYYEACLGIIHQHVPGSITWMGIWSLTPAVDLQCDFSCMISCEAFDELFLPSVRQQTEWVPRTVYHLDGPNALHHLPALLALPRLSGVQWVPGAGFEPMSRWIDLVRTILEAGKRCYIGCNADEVERLMAELPQPGLLIRTSCSSVEEADRLLEDARHWTR